MVRQPLGVTQHRYYPICLQSQALTLLGFTIHTVSGLFVTGRNKSYPTPTMNEVPIHSTERRNAVVKIWVAPLLE